MKPLPDEFLDTAEGLAGDSMKKIKAYYAYEGDDRRYLEKAKIAASMIGAFSRLRATETNHLAVKLAAAKHGVVDGAAKSK